MFTGFSKETGEFLWELAFHNERPWFLEHKEQFERTLNEPFRALAREVYDELRRLAPEEPAWFDPREGGLVCADHGAQGLPRLTPADRRFLRHTEETPASQWLAAPDRTPPLGVMRQYVESRLDLPVRAKLPEVAR